MFEKKKKASSRSLRGKTVGGKNRTKASPPSENRCKGAPLMFGGGRKSDILKEERMGGTARRKKGEGFSNRGDTASGHELSWEKKGTDHSGIQTRGGDGGKGVGRQERKNKKNGKKKKKM